jgi:hypothetical protein
MLPPERTLVTVMAPRTMALPEDEEELEAEELEGEEIEGEELDEDAPETAPESADGEPAEGA